MINEYKWADGDARLALYKKCINSLNSVQLALMHAEINLINPHWWHLEDATISAEDIQIYVNEYMTFVKVSFIQAFFSSIESSFRVIIRNLDPGVCSKGTAEFKSIYLCILSKLDLQKYKETFDILRCIRNLIHNNGVYYHRSWKNEEIEFQGKKYVFEIGKAVDFVTWDFLFKVINEIREIIRSVISAEAIKELPAFSDPFSQDSAINIVSKE